MNIEERIAKIRENEKRQEFIGERLDGADLISILFAICEDSEEIPLECLDGRMMKNIIRATQSNPERSYAILKEWLELDEEIEKLDREGQENDE